MNRAVLVVVGAYLCLVGALVHRQTVYVHGVGWPWGLVLVLGATVAVVRAAMIFSRTGAAWLGLGWSMVLVALQFSPGTGLQAALHGRPQDYLVASDWLGVAFSAGCLGVIVVGAVRTPSLDQ